MIDIYDVRAVAARIGVREGEANYDPAADTDKDGDIDIIDLRSISGLYGQGC